MICARHKRGCLAYYSYWFGLRPEPLRAASLTAFMHCCDVGPVAGYTRRLVHTKIVDLSREENDLLADCKKNTVYEFRRAERDGITMAISTDLEAFVTFYNNLAARKRLEQLAVHHLSAYLDNVQIMQAMFEGQALVMNFYLVDREQARARMVYSASHFRELDRTDARAFIGRANRFLQWATMKYFKASGILYYDQGGYAVGSEDPELQHINQFKDSFGGNLVAEAVYLSWPLAAASWVRHLLKGRRAWA